jgi:tetratricopeptide (TPR) repeat protein
LFQRALEVDPNLAEAYMQTGFILSQRNERHSEAIEAYQQALRANPNVGGAYTRIGLIYLHQNKLEEAEAVLREELRVGIPNPLTYYNLGQALALRKNHEEALPFLEKSLELDPLNRMAYYALAQSQMALGKTEAGQKSLARFRELKKEEDEARVDPTVGSSNRDEQLKWTSDVWMDAGLLYVIGKNQSTSKARKSTLNRSFLHSLHEAMRFNPESPDPREALFGYYETEKEYVRAGELCLTLLEQFPTKELIPKAYNVSGFLLQPPAPGASLEPTAVELSFRILKLLVKVVPTFADAHRELARVVLFHLNHQKELIPLALKHARTSVELEPSAANYDVLGFALMRSGRTQEAKETLQEGVARHPENERLKNRLSRVLAQTQ